MNDRLTTFLNRNFSLLIYLFSVFCSFYLLYLARGDGLLPRPIPGTDQLSMYKAAVGLYRGRLPGSGYMYSPVYTFFLFLLVVVSQGNLVIMRALQALLCGLAPVMIYKTSLRLRFGRSAAQLSAILYCFYGAALLISLDFLRAVPLGLCFISMVYFLVRGYVSRSSRRYFWAGILGGLCILGRENFIPLVAVPLLMLLLPDIRKNVRVKFVALYVLAIVAVILPVMIYNYVEYNALTIVPGHVVNVLGAYHGDAAVASRELAVMSILKNIPAQLFNFASSYEIPNSLSFYAHREVIDFLKVFLIPFNLLLILAAVMLGLKFKHRGVLLLWLLIASYAGSMAFFTMFYRFRIPAVPLVATLAGAGIIALVDAFRKRKYALAGGFSAAALILLFLTWQNPDYRRPQGERHSVARHLVMSKRFVAAESYINRLRQQKIPGKGLEILLIREIDRSGNREKARALYIQWFGLPKNIRPEPKKNSR